MWQQMYSKQKSEAEGSAGWCGPLSPTIMVKENEPFVVKYPISEHNKDENSISHQVRPRSTANSMSCSSKLVAVRVHSFVLVLIACMCACAGAHQLQDCAMRQGR